MSIKVGIICAGDRELAPFLDHINNVKVSEKAMLKIHEGTINGINSATLYSGVCKVNAAIATQILIDNYGVDIVINSGTAGGLDSELNIFDTVISTEVAYHDVDDNILTEFHPWMKDTYFKADNELVRLSKNAVEKYGHKHKVYWGRMVTGEAFISDDGRQAINDTYSPLSVDMESASIAHVCYVNNVPFISIRTITDTEDHSGEACFEENCDKASEISKDITLALLEKIIKR